jgi:hypothetical protein
MTDERQERTIRSPLGDRPAFPETSYYDETPTGQISGLTKREHYASLFVSAFLANPAGDEDLSECANNLVNMAIQFADILVSKLAEADRGDS